jgi:hypothetical protein
VLDDLAVLCDRTGRPASADSMRQEGGGLHQAFTSAREKTCNRFGFLLVFTRNYESCRRASVCSEASREFSSYRPLYDQGASEYHF